MNTSKLAARFRRGGSRPASPTSGSEPTQIERAIEAPEATIQAPEAPSADEATAPGVAGSESQGMPAETAKPEMAAADEPRPSRASRLVEIDRKPTGMAHLSERLSAAAKAAKPRIDAAATSAAVPMAAAAALVLSLGIGYGIGVSHAERPGDEAAIVRWSQASADLRRTREEVGRLTAEFTAVKGSVESLKGERDKGRDELLAKQAQLGEKLDRSGHDQAARFARLGEQLDRLEKMQKDPARIQATTERLERIERNAASTPVAAAPTPPPKPVATASSLPDVTQTGSLPDLRTTPDPRKTKIDGVHVRDFDDGYALIETRQGGYLEVAVGSFVPGIGRVEAIERRGRQWVVVTAKGFIAER